MTPYFSTISSFNSDQYPISSKSTAILNPCSTTTESYKRTLQDIYPKLEKISFDNAILEKLDPKYANVLSVDIGWSDIGAWEALKEALSERENENVTKGKVLLEDSSDTLMFNFTDQLAVGIDLEKMLKDKIANYSYFQDYENLKKAYKEYRKVLKDMGEEYLYKGKIGLPCITIEDRDTYNVDEYGYKIFVKTETKIVKVCEF